MQYKKRPEKHKKHIKKQVKHAQAEINRHIQIEHYSYILHQQFIQMLASRNTFTQVSDWTLQNGVDLKKENQDAESSLKANRMDLFGKVQQVENLIDIGYAQNPNADYHQMPQDKQIAHKKALAQNIVMINEVYNNGSQEDKQAIETWLKANNIDPSKLKEGMTVSELIQKERPNDATIYFKLGKDLKEIKETLSQNTKEIIDVFDITTNRLNLENVSKNQ